MILVFGGTTEGRKAAEVLEEAGNGYYYSTKTGEQDIVLHHGQRIDGAMDAAAMMAFCQEHDIRLIVDAAHPFASQLHETIMLVADKLHIPVIRYERIYPPRDANLTWIDDYSQVPTDIHTLLATTGVQSISKLKPLEALGIKVYYRILKRESSIASALKQGANEEQLCYYDNPNDIPVDAEAILLKESGISGGFPEKVEAAKEFAAANGDEYQNFSIDYSLYDMDHDGTPELFIKYGKLDFRPVLTTFGSRTGQHKDLRYNWFF